MGIGTYLLVINLVPCLLVVFCKHTSKAENPLVCITASLQIGYRRIRAFPGKLAMVASTVSSKMVEAMAHAEGFKFVDCLTGIP